MIAAASILATACASTSRETVRLEAADTLALAKSDANSDLSTTTATVGLAAFAFGDRYTATNLLEHATADRDSVINRFNLAAGYQATGRPEQAAPLYAQLVTDGAFTHATTSANYIRPGKMRGFNVADESARRLATLRATRPVRLARVAASASDLGAPASASDFGVPASANVGANPASGYIPDQQAQALDRANERPVVR